MEERNILDVSLPPQLSSPLIAQSPIVPEALVRIKGMFAEMPGAEWTVNDAARLSGLEGWVCRAILDALRDAGYLRQRVNGSYLRSQILTAQPG